MRWGWQLGVEPVEEVAVAVAVDLADLRASEGALGRGHAEFAEWDDSGELWGEDLRTRVVGLNDSAVVGIKGHGFEAFGV